MCLLHSPTAAPTELANAIGELQGFASLGDPLAWVRDNVRSKVKGREALTALISDCCQVAQGECDANNEISGRGGNEQQNKVTKWICETSKLISSLFSHSNDMGSHCEIASSDSTGDGEGTGCRAGTSGMQIYMPTPHTHTHTHIHTPLLRAMTWLERNEARRCDPNPLRGILAPHHCPHSGLDTTWCCPTCQGRGLRLSALWERARMHLWMSLVCCNNLPNANLKHPPCLLSRQRR